MNRNNLIAQFTDVITKKLRYEKPMKHSEKPSKFFVPNYIGKLMFGPKERVEYIIILNGEIYIDTYKIDNNGDYLSNTTKRYSTNKSERNVITINMLLDLLEKINNLYIKQ